MHAAFEYSEIWQSLPLWLVDGERWWRGGGDYTVLGRVENQRREEEALERGCIPGKGKGCDKDGSPTEASRVQTAEIRHEASQSRRGRVLSAVHRRSNGLKHF
jgi:hypothetical protein